MLFFIWTQSDFVQFDRIVLFGFIQLFHCWILLRLSKQTNTILINFNIPNGQSFQNAPELINKQDDISNNSFRPNQLIFLGLFYIFQKQFTICQTIQEHYKSFKLFGYYSITYQFKQVYYHFFNPLAELLQAKIQSYSLLQLLIQLQRRIICIRYSLSQMQKNLSEKRFKTAGARILRTKKLPKDFFANNDRNLSSSGSVHSSKEKQEKIYPAIFEFTFMAKQNHSLRKTKSNTFESTKVVQLPFLKKSTVQKENGTLSLPILKKGILKQLRQVENFSQGYKRKLQKISLAQFAKNQLIPGNI